MKKSSFLRASLVILTACVFLAFLFVACEHGSNANSNSPNTGTTATTPSTPVNNPSTNPEPAPTTPETPASDPDSELPEGSYSITFVLDGGSWVENFTPPASYTADDYVSLPNAGKIHREGYTFKGWYDNNTLIFGFAKGTTGNKTYTAHWQEGEYAPVGYRKNGTTYVPCEAGKYQSNTNRTDCTATPAGHYTDTEGASAPIPCPVGYFQNYHASSTCTPSPTGKYVSTTGATAATPCPAGYYQDQRGQSSCKPCPEGTTSNEGSTACY